jgi:hypothetical protein
VKRFSLRLFGVKMSLRHAKKAGSYSAVGVNTYVPVPYVPLSMVVTRVQFSLFGGKCHSESLLLSILSHVDLARCIRTCSC